MLSHLVYAVKSSDVEMMFIAGEKVVKQGLKSWVENFKKNYTKF